MADIALKNTAARLYKVRSELLREYPFFGRLLLRLSFGFSDCQTAFTDMKRIVFDPSFAERLNDDELKFVLLHELMHCVLKHCMRGSGKLHIVYNIACDIVVNSVILEALSKKEYKVDGEAVIHKAPDGEEGSRYTAEEIYEMLIKKTPKELCDMYFPFDNHEPWSELSSDSVLSDMWDKYITDAAKSAGNGSGVPEGIKRMVGKLEGKQKIDWRETLRNYIQFDRSDYIYTQPDRRFDGDFIMPSFSENENGGKAEQLFFAVDTSGSISEEALTEALSEIADAIRQVGNLSGKISFFDCEITEPQEFSAVEDVEKAQPVGGGGTSFSPVFAALDRYFQYDLPRVIIILTDGYAAFPDESLAKGIDVIWLIVDSEAEPPWGEIIKIKT